MPRMLYVSVLTFSSHVTESDLSRSNNQHFCCFLFSFPVTASKIWLNLFLRNLGPKSWQLFLKHWNEKDNFLLPLKGRFWVLRKQCSGLFYPEFPAILLIFPTGNGTLDQSTKKLPCINYRIYLILHIKIFFIISLK